MQIIRRLESLRGREHAATCDLIEMLVTCHRTKAHVDAGHASIWDLLVRRLKYSPAAASRRNAATKFALASRRVLPLLRAHRTNLTALAKAVSLLKNDVAPDAVLDAIADKSADDVDRAIAEFRPRRMPVERVRTVVVEPARTCRVGAARSGSARAERADVAAARATTAQSAPPPLLESKPVVSSAAEPRRRVTLSFSVDEEAYAKYQRARAILSRKNPDGLTLETVFNAFVGFYLEKKTPKERTPADPPMHRTRHVPAATRDHVMHRDEARCTYVAPDGTRCGSTHAVQIDHVRPWAKGGTHDATNLRVLCAAHNRRRNDAQRE